LGLPAKHELDNLDLLYNFTTGEWSVRSTRGVQWRCRKHKIVFVFGRGSAPDPAGVLTTLHSP